MVEGNQYGRQYPQRRVEQDASDSSGESESERSPNDALGRTVNRVFNRRSPRTNRSTQREVPVNTTEKEPGAEICIHHWIVGPPSGDKSSGTCKKCGETRVFISQSEKWTPPKKPEPGAPPAETPTLDN